MKISSVVGLNELYCLLILCFCVYSAQLSLLGTMSQKLVIKATDDVYKATKDRMALAEEESKKSWSVSVSPTNPDTLYLDSHCLLAETS